MSYFQKITIYPGFLFILMHSKELTNETKGLFYTDKTISRCNMIPVLLIVNCWDISSAPQSCMFKRPAFISRSIFACDHFILAH